MTVKTELEVVFPVHIRRGERQGHVPAEQGDVGGTVAVRVTTGIRRARSDAGKALTSVSVCLVPG